MFVFVQSSGTALETGFSFIGYISLRHLRLEPSPSVPYCLLTGVGILIALWVDLAPLCSQEDCSLLISVFPPPSSFAWCIIEAQSAWAK